jgi:hypothetical protein
MVAVQNGTHLATAIPRFLATFGLKGVDVAGGDAHLVIFDIHIIPQSCSDFDDGVEGLRLSVT